MRVLISGGPGAGCTSTAERIASGFDLVAFDSDSYFHKLTDPPFQEPYSPDERRCLLSEALDRSPRWIVSGSIATWGLDLQPVSLGIFLDTPAEERLGRLMLRERQRFGGRIDAGGDLHEENREFMQWAAGYETRTGSGRNRRTDRDFLIGQCERFIEIDGQLTFEEVVSEIHGALAALAKMPLRR